MSTHNVRFYGEISKNYPLIITKSVRLSSSSITEKVPVVALVVGPAVEAVEASVDDVVAPVPSQEDRKKLY